MFRCSTSEKDINAVIQPSKAPVVNDKKKILTKSRTANKRVLISKWAVPDG